MSSVHGPPIQKGEVNFKERTHGHRPRHHQAFQALNAHHRLDLSDCQRRRGGHARCRTGNRSRPTKLLRPASSFGDTYLHDFMFLILLHLHHLVMWVLLLWVVLRLLSAMPAIRHVRPWCAHTASTSGSRAGPPSAAPLPASDKRSEGVRAETPMMAESGGRW